MAEQKEFKHDETEFIYDKKMTCPICETNFTTKVLKSSKARRLGSDDDLRPIFKDIDTVKYSVCACPQCGYAALHNQFPQIGGYQAKAVRENIATLYKGTDRSNMKTYTYDAAIEMHKLAYMSASVKLAKDGEKSYICLLLAWLYRGKAEELTSDAEKAKCHEDEDRFYRQAYDGFQKAVMNEHPPIMGMSQESLDYILSYMAFHFGELENASKLISGVMTSSNTGQAVKDKAYDLKEKIVAAIAEAKGK